MNFTRVSIAVTKRTLDLSPRALFATNAAPDLDQEWKSARSHSKIPGPNTWELINLFRPGGDLHGKDLFSIQEEFQKRYGNICKLPGLLNNSDIVFVYEPEDMEKIYRNEGKFPVRRGFDSMDYYRKVWRKDLYQKSVGLGVGLVGK